ncbi:FHA domain-containing protein, partial [Acinetobacter baumannii]
KGKVSAKLKISEPDGKTWEFSLEPGRILTIGRSKDNDVVLNDRRVSRKHAHIVGTGGDFTIVDGFYENGELRRSINHVFVNGTPVMEK